MQDGVRHWMIAGGPIPARGTGHEPAFTSHDRLAILNTTDERADIEMHVLFDDADPIGPFRVSVAARRVRLIRINDLIDPQALPLCVPYAVRIDASCPVVVQLTRQDTRQSANAVMGSVAFPG